MKSTETPVIHRWEIVSCSNCGREFGPGHTGFSHCANHAGLPSTDNVTQDVRMGVVLPNGTATYMYAEEAMEANAVQIGSSPSGKWRMSSIGPYFG